MNAVIRLWTLLASALADIGRRLLPPNSEVNNMPGTMFLRVKIRSLAAEAAIIRHEERRYRYRRDIRLSLAHHRRTTVRSEARQTLLAYGYLRGRSLVQIESKAHTEPDWKAVERMVRRYGEGFDEKRFETWRKR